MFWHFLRACFTTWGNSFCTLGSLCEIGCVELWVIFEYNTHWIHGTIVYLDTYMHCWVDLYVLNVGKYTSPIDPMGTYLKFHSLLFPTIDVTLHSKNQRINLHVSSLMISNPQKCCTYLPQKQGFHSNGVHKPCNGGPVSRYVIFPPPKKNGVFQTRDGKNHHIMHSCESSKVQNSRPWSPPNHPTRNSWPHFRGSFPICWWLVIPAIPCFQVSRWSFKPNAKARMTDMSWEGKVWFTY